MRLRLPFIIFLTALLTTFASTPTLAHHGHSDPVLAELNDYLMALQIMRASDPKAVEIFKTWHDLRTASWKIRELTDSEGLLIHTDKVIEQISATRAMRKKLLQECRSYFAEAMQKEAAIRFTIGESITLDWGNPLLKVQMQHRKVILIEINNQTDLPAALRMRANPSDAVLFWNKHLLVAPQASRFTFAVCAPYALRQFNNLIQITDSLGKKSEAMIRMRGIPISEQPYWLLPGEYLSKVALPVKSGLPFSQPESFSNAVKFNITDQQNAEPLTARIEVRDEGGVAYWFPIEGPAYGVSRTSGWNTPLWEHQPGPYFYVGGKAALGVDPAGKRATIYHGFEYKPVRLEIPPDGQVNVAMERWINMPERGWYAGHTHIHTTDAGMPVQFSQHWPLVAQGEDLHVSAILTLKGEWETHAIYADEFPMGKREAFSTADHIIVYGEEYRNNPYGHLAFLGLDELIQPISSGALGELGGPDYPSNAQILEEALEQEATTIAAHFGNFTHGVEQVQTPWPSTGFEMPVDIALGKIQLAEIYGNGGQLDVWYDVLNCGFKIPATAGPDWTIKDSPRVYVNLEDQKFTLKNWLAGLQRGRSFITRGPMLFFSVNNLQPGSEIALGKDGAQVRVQAKAMIPSGQVPLEIVFNGEVIASGLEVSTNIKVEESGWLAARCEGAHSNPVYIRLAGKPAGKAAPAQKFINIIDRLEDWVQQKGLFDNEAQKQEVLNVIGEGRQVYQDIIKQVKEAARK